MMRELSTCNVIHQYLHWSQKGDVVIQIRKLFVLECILIRVVQYCIHVLIKVLL